MQLHTLLAALPNAHITGPTARTITTLAYDSRAVQPGSLFVAINGYHVDGHTYIPQALARGASAILAQTAPPPDLHDTTWIHVPDTRTALAPIAAAFYDHPGAALRVIGITGTDGKTTTTALTSTVLEAGGHTTGMIGTVDFKIAQRQWANATRQSTPEAPDIQTLLRDMVTANCDYAVIEATSHALSARWNRLGGCAFDIALLTNVTLEHLEYHGTVEQYRRDKARLFELLGEHTPHAPHKNRKIAIVNADDPHHRLFLDAAPANAERLTYAIHHPADIRADSIVSHRNGLTFRVTTPWGSAEPHLKLTGDFNIWNALAALTIGLAENIPLATCIHALETVTGVRGRMQPIDAGQPFTLLVDYAHTPGSFEKLMTIMRPLTTGKLIAVFGSGGERDHEKRPLQGQIAAHSCDLIILTDEDPRGEDRNAIIAEIASGIERTGKRLGTHYLTIPDRPTAIRTACERAAPGDIVLLLGKGHENCILYADHKLPWDEAAEARAALHELGYPQPEHPPTNQTSAQ